MEIKCNLKVYNYNSCKPLEQKQCPPL